MKGVERMNAGMCSGADDIMNQSENTKRSILKIPASAVLVCPTHDAITCVASTKCYIETLPLLAAQSSLRLKETERRGKAGSTLY